MFSTYIPLPSSQSHSPSALVFADLRVCLCVWCTSFLTAVFPQITLQSRLRLFQLKLNIDCFSSTRRSPTRRTRIVFALSTDLTETDIPTTVRPVLQLVPKSSFSSPRKALFSRAVLARSLRSLRLFNASYRTHPQHLVSRHVSPGDPQTPSVPALPLCVWPL